MNRVRRIGVAALLAAIALITVTAGQANAFPSAWQTAPWHAGRHWYDFYTGGGPGCTVGVQLYSTTGKFFLVEPLHCLTAGGTFPGNPYWGMYEGDTNNKHGSGNIILPPAPYNNYDMALVELGPNPTAKSDYLFDYCNPAQPWNCTSSFGGGTVANPNWAGHWRQSIGWLAGAIPTGLALAKGGMRSGTSNGNVLGSANYGPPIQWAYSLSLNNCGSADGDSGGPVYAPSGNDYDYVAGMIIGWTGTQYAAGAGNSCYAQGTVYRTTALFYSIDQIKVVFDSTVGALTPW